MKKKILCCLFCVVFLVSAFSISTSALSIQTLYGDITPSSSQTENLISLALNYDSFLDSDYVVFRSGQYEYYIVWGDLTSHTTSVTANDTVEYIKYYRNGNNYDSTYVYEYGTDTDFTLMCNYLCVSNIDGFGFISPIYSTYKFNHNIINFAIFGLALLFVITLVKLRRA